MTGHPAERQSDPLLALHLLTLWAVAVAHPLFAVLANSPHFFVAHRSTPGDILLFVLLVVVVAPAPLIMTAALARRAGMPRVAPATAVAVLFAILVLPIVGRASWMPAAMTLALAALAGAAIGALYVGSAGIRLFVTYLSPALIVVPAAFLFGSDVSRLLRPPSPDTTAFSEEAQQVPVVLVVFDELPLVSLLDEEWAIDRRLFPNLAAFSSEATWFRNATTVSEGTVHAIPAILSGRYPERNRLPTARDHPGTLFTLLAETHDVHASEAGTQLCPPHVCTADSDGRSRAARMSSLAADATVVLLHIVLPPALRAHLPPVRDTWSGFWVAGPPENDDTDHAAAFHRFARAVGADRMATFEQFIADVREHPGGERPRFEYLHAMLVHLPWLELASGHAYDSRQQIDGRLPEEVWRRDPQIVAEAHYRHLQSAANADRLVGRLMDGLKQARIYDKALIILTSDHGAAFRAGEPRRNVHTTNLGEIVTVPLLMKLPRQRRGELRDEPVETLDIAPTVAEVLGISIPWSINGQSLLAPMQTRRRAVYTVQHSRLDLPERLDELIAEPVTAKLAIPHHPVLGWLWPGPDTDLVGTRTSDIEAGTSQTLAVRIHDAHLLRNVDLHARFVPALQRGLVEGLGPDAPEPRLAIALNETIAATAWGRWNGQGHEFSAVVPIDLLRSGNNALDVFLVTPRPSRLLHRLREGFRGEYRLVRSGARETIVDGDGRQYAVRPGAVQGWVDVWESLDSTTSRASGWAVDPTGIRPADSVVAFLDGELAGLALMRQSRPDVAQVFGRADTDPSGFILDLGVPHDEGFGSELRIFALSGGGYASELVNPVAGVALGPRHAK